MALLQRFNNKLKQDYKNKYPILIVPGPNEIKEANTL